MAASEQKLNKIFDQNVEITGTLEVGGTLTVNGTVADLSNYLTSFTETDPIFSASAAAGITSTNISNWNTAYGWGDHADAGYLTSVPADISITTGTFSGRVKADTLELTSGTAHLTFTESGLDWSIINNYAGYNNGIAIYNGTGGVDIIYDEATIAEFDTNGVTFHENVTVNGTISATGYNKTNWDTAYGWGDHASAGYLTSGSSGINADTLDSLNSTQFLRSDTSDTMSGTLTINGYAYINPSSTVALLLGRVSGTPTIQANTDDGGHLMMDSNGGVVGLNWYNTNNVVLAQGGGNVGIGSSTVSHKLDVHGNIGMGEYLYHRDDTNTYLRFLGDQALLVAGGRVVIGLDEGTDPDKIQIGDSATYTYTDGRLGINTSTPTQDFHVVGSALFGESSDVSYAAPIKIRTSSDGFIGMVRTGIRTWAHNIGSDGHYYLRNVDGSYNVLNITDDNKVGIGKTPSYQLDVNASIRAGDNLYIGTGGGFFYNDSGSRIRTNYDFYTNNSNTYLYATNLYLGAGSGDNVQVRGNRMYGNNWEIDTDGSAGFGTASAASQVHIVDTAFPQLRVHDDTGGGKGGIRLKSHNGTNGLHADIYVQRTGNETGYMSFQVPYNGRELRLSNNGSLTLGIAGNGSNTNGRYLSFEGNTDSSGEGSGRLFFTEHNSTTASMDNYGMSIGYRGGGTSVTTAGGNTWTGLSQIGNGQWGMWGHDNNLAGNLIMYGDRQATYVDFAGNNIQGITDIYVADQIIHTGDTDTYIQFHGANLFRVVIAGGEVTEWGNNYMKMRDSDTIRLGEGSDFRMWHDGTNHYFRNYHHASGNIYWQGENTSGSNQALMYMYCNSARTHVRLYENGLERLRTIDGGVTAYGRIELDDSNTKLLKGSGNNLKIQTNSGYVQVGPQNTSWCHFITDRGGNYFDKKVIVNSGVIGSYDEDLVLVRANSTSDCIRVRSTNIGFILDSAEDMRLENDGDLHVEGDVIAYSSTISDIRLKDEVKTIDNALGKIKSLRGVEYVWNKGHREGQRDLGLIAQEVEQVLPEIVREKKMPLMDDSEEKYKTVDYEKVVGVLIEAVKELSNKVEELENKLNGSIGTEA